MLEGTAARPVARELLFDAVAMYVVKEIVSSKLYN